MTGESNRQRQRSLLSLGCLTTRIASIQRQRDVITLWSDRRVTAKTIVVERFAKRPFEVAAPRLLVRNADDRIVFRELVVVVRDERRDVVEQLFSKRDEFFTDAAEVTRPDVQFTLLQCRRTIALELP